MHRWRFPSVVTFALLLTVSCPFTQIAEWWATSQDSDSTITANPPAQSNGVSSTGSDILPHTPPDDCAVTQPSQPRFVPPPPYTPDAPYGFWYGTAALWTVIPRDSTWSSLPHTARGYTQKVLWWREGYSWTEEPQPQLFVTGQRLDMPAAPLKASRATNAFAADIQSAMLVGVDLPTDGCWAITGRYGDAELSFVVWVTP